MLIINTSCNSHMKRKHFWAWVIFVGFAIMTLGSFIAFIPYIGLPMMFLGVVIVLIAIPFLVRILLQDRKKDYSDMEKDISKEDLRP